jgi:hypothetical protein
MHFQACGLLYLLGSRVLRGQRVDGELIVDCFDQAFMIVGQHELRGHLDPLVGVH